jgi:hypothetical protein
VGLGSIAALQTSSNVLLIPPLDCAFSYVAHDAYGVLRLVERINLQKQDVKSRRIMAGLLSLT